MIRYTLACSAAHQFESWFPDSAAADQQIGKGLVVCPHCGSVNVEKTIMAPAIGNAGRGAGTDASDPQPVALLSEHEKEARRLLKQLRDHVKKHADYVGPEFPHLARQMHHQEIETRSIYGEAKPDEARKLIEEGIEVQPLPILPDERN